MEKDTIALDAAEARAGKGPELTEQQAVDRLLHVHNINHKRETLRNLRCSPFEIDEWARHLISDPLPSTHVVAERDVAVSS